MLSETTLRDQKPAVGLLQHQRRKCVMIATYVILQCALALVGSSTILLCVWSPEGIKNDYDKLSRIMYLYDPNACRYRLRTVRTITGVILNNSTEIGDLHLIRYKKPIITVSISLSSRTRRYMGVSIALHVIWLVASIMLYVVKWLNQSSIRISKIILITFLCCTGGITAFDMSMAIVYIAHIQQSLTKSMVLRYSGWSVELKLNSYEDYGGWLPIIASICWIRGVVFLAFNIFCCRVIRKMLKKIKKKELKRRLIVNEILPFPEPDRKRSMEPGVLYYRRGERNPQFVHQSRLGSLHIWN